MHVATWNVNSLRVRLAHVLDWLGTHRPDALLLQETKVTDDAFPVDAFAQSGYTAAFAGQKTYNGVALLSLEPAGDVSRDIPGLEDPDRRMIAATVAGVRLVNLYVVNGQAPGTDKYAWKLEWLAAVRAMLETELRHHADVVVAGDFNIAPTDEDVHDPEAWREQILCTSEERAALAAILNLGFEDVFRRFAQPAGSYSWWDYRAAAFRRNRGLRIDLVLASEALAGRCTGCAVDREPRGLERPSDHAPVWARFDG